MRVSGRCSWFGGPDDIGVDADEGLAFIAEYEQAPHLFLDQQPPGTTGLARRLNADKVFYIACRWDYDETPAYMLLENMASVRSIRTGKKFNAYPADWGPHEDTGRIADLSPALLSALDIETDDEVEVIFPSEGVPIMPYESIVISAGHSAKCRGAVGIIDEYDENVKVVNKTAELLRARGINVKTFIDTTSTSQNENLNKIVDYHNAQTRQLDVSIHFNASQATSAPVGTECYYVTQSSLAAAIADAIAECGLKDRGPKYNGDLFFLNNTDEPAILVEVCFVDSEADVDIYRANFDAICDSIADVLGGEGEEEVEPPPPDRPGRPHRPDRPARPSFVTISINAPPNVRIIVRQNEV